MTKKKSSHGFTIGYAKGFKSGLEEVTAKQLENEGISPNYEQLKLEYTIPASKHTYKPDFPVMPPLIIETKGYFSPDDRKKMLLVKEQFPSFEFRLLFSNSKTKINKKSKTTYADWCEKNGFKCADKTVPQQWIEEIRRYICTAK